MAQLYFIILVLSINMFLNLILTLCLKLPNSREVVTTFFLKQQNRFVSNKT